MKTIEQREVVVTHKAMLVEGEPVFFATPPDLQDWFDYEFKIKPLMGVNVEGDSYAEDARAESDEAAMHGVGLTVSNFVAWHADEETSY